MILRTPWDPSTQKELNKEFIAKFERFDALNKKGRSSN
jgi:hypothetical protein